VQQPLCIPSAANAKAVSVVSQVLTNAGQANAATGDQGYEDAVNCATITAASLGVTPDDVLLMSTGKSPQLMLLFVVQSEQKLLQAAL
jgi:glutamate N-acetyltransferase/amino-acid N-acetyltransferase